VLLTEGFVSPAPTTCVSFWIGDEGFYDSGDLGGGRESFGGRGRWWRRRGSEKSGVEITLDG